MSEWKHRTTEEARDALSRFCTRKASVMTVPVDNERDADCILSDVIRERDHLLEILKELTPALARFGYDSETVRMARAALPKVEAK